MSDDERYEPPTLEVLGTIRALTLSGNGKAGDLFSPTGNRGHIT